jgi:hypothetical protein
MSIRVKNENVSSSVNRIKGGEHTIALVKYGRMIKTLIIRRLDMKKMAMTACTTGRAGMPGTASEIRQAPGNGRKISWHTLLLLPIACVESVIIIIG